MCIYIYIHIAPLYRTSKSANAAEKFSAFWARCHESPVKHFISKEGIFKKNYIPNIPKRSLNKNMHLLI